MRCLIWVALLVLLSSVAFADIVVNDVSLPAVEESALDCRQDALAERVECWVGKYDGDVIKYIPEQCRLLSTDARAECLALFNAWKPCSLLDTALKQESCVAKKFSMPSFETKYKECMQKQSEARDYCLQKLSSAILLMARYRLSNLVDKAVAARKAGVSVDRVSGIIQRVVNAEARLQKVTARPEARQILADVRRDWSLFAKQAQEELYS